MFSVSECCFSPECEEIVFTDEYVRSFVRKLFTGGRGSPFFSFLSNENQMRKQLNFSHLILI